MNAPTDPAAPAQPKKWWKRWWVWACLAVLPFLAVAILFLAGIAIVNMNMRGGLPDAGVQTARAQMQSFEVALLSYRAKAGFYPTTAQGLDALRAKPTTPPIPKAWSALLKTLPLDPWGHPFVYRMPGANPAMAYDLSSLGPDGVPSADDIVLSEPVPSTPPAQKFKLEPSRSIGPEPPLIRLDRP